MDPIDRKVIIVAAIVGVLYTVCAFSWDHIATAKRSRDKLAPPALLEKNEGISYITLDGCQYIMVHSQIILHKANCTNHTDKL